MSSAEQASQNCKFADMKKYVWLPTVRKFCARKSHELGRKRDEGDRLAEAGLSRYGHEGGRSKINGLRLDCRVGPHLEARLLSGVGCSLATRFKFAFSTTSFMNTSLEHCTLTRKISSSAPELKTLAVSPIYCDTLPPMPTTSGKRPSNVSLPDLNVSLGPHLIRDLLPLPSLLPNELASELNSALKDHIPHGGEPSSDDTRQETSLISYRLLYSISVWARSPHGKTTLSSHIPVLDPNQYTMIALLAGSKTSPERKFPMADTWSRDNEAEAKRELSDRRAVVAVLNALLSILGSGAATWWAAEKLQWRDEWKVLLALAAAIIVAASEGILYLIWDSRRSNNLVRSSVSRSQEMKMGNKVIETTSNPATPDEIQDPAVDSLVTSSPNLRLHHDNNSLRERTRKSGLSQEEG